MTNFSLDDLAHMRAALRLAERGLGNVWPNPAVGCLLVKDECVVGRGWTQPTGRPHAETVAINRAGIKAKGSTAYVTLEPCSHTGKTPPCAKAMIDADIKHVVVALEDPDERVSGCGVSMLQDAGIQVDVGCLKDEAAHLNSGFLRRVIDARPMVSVKVATTLDGCIASYTGESQWITGDQARLFGHQLRATYDAVMVGIGTVLADDPSLNCRLPGFNGKQPVRVVLDSNLRIPMDCKLVLTANIQPTWVITAQGTNLEKSALLEDAGVKILTCPIGGDKRLDIAPALKLLGAQGITRLLLEGGGQLTSSMLKARYVDRLFWFRAASIMGGDGIKAIAPYGVKDLADMVTMKRHSHLTLGNDQLDIFEIA